MTYRILFFAIFILLTATAAFAQSVEQQVGKIRQLSAEINQRIEEGLEDRSAGFHHAAITVGGDKDGQQWRAVGSHNEMTEFYFDCEPEEPECGKDVRRFIVKIVRTYQAGSSITSRYEYLFNEQGELVFAFTTEPDDDGNPEECRLYFAAKKLVRVVRSGKNTDSKFSAADLQKSREETAAAKRLQNLFAQIL